MPREVVHGYIALEALDKTTLLAHNDPQHNMLRNCFLLGTCSPDSGYYCLSKKIKGEDLSDALHLYEEQDAFSLLKKILYAKEITNETEAPIIFFCLGLMSHILVDAYFHPYIFKITGDYYDPNKFNRVLARARHRKVETILDHALSKKKMLNCATYKVSSYLQALGNSAQAIDTVFTKELHIPKNSLHTAWQWHSMFQKIFTHDTLSRYSKHLPISIQFKALFNDENLVHTAHIEKSMSIFYKEQFDQIISNCVSFVHNVFEKFEFNRETFTTDCIGPSPSSGKVGIAHYDGIYEIDEHLLNIL